MNFCTSRITFSITDSETSVSKGLVHSFIRRLESGCRCRRTHHTEHYLLSTANVTPCPPFRMDRKDIDYGPEKLVYMTYSSLIWGLPA